MFEQIADDMIEKVWRRIEGVFFDFWKQTTDAYEYFAIPEFWVWLFWGLIVIVIATMLAWFFQPLRPIAGAVFVAVLAALYGHHRGQKEERRKSDAREHDARD